MGTGLATGGAGVPLVFLGAFPPVDFRAVCLLRAILPNFILCSRSDRAHDDKQIFFLKIISENNTKVKKIFTVRIY